MSEIIKICPVCNKDFVSRSYRHKYCSRECQLKARFIEHTWEERPCPPLNIKSDLALVTADWHIPFDKEEYVNLIYEIAETHEIPDLIVIGDFWDCDNYSRYTQYHIEKTFQDEIRLVTTRLKEIVDFFENAYFCVGNHEARFLAANADEWRRGHLRYKQMMNMTGIVDGYEVTDNRWMILNNKWRLTHPKNYSRRKLKVAASLANKYLMNIINTHGHYTAGTPIGQAFMKPDYHVARDIDTREVLGVFRIADIGGLFDAKKMEYVTLIDSTYPRLNPGFAIYDHGEMTIIDLERFLKNGGKL